jgi:hypothetical protein
MFEILDPGQIDPAEWAAILLDDAICEEVAAALRLPPRTARIRIASARALVGPHAPMHVLLAQGAI